MLSPLTVIKSVLLGRMPKISANSKLLSFLTHIIPAVFERTVFELEKKRRYCVLSGITTEVNSSTSDTPAKRSCICRLIVPSSTSPMFAVPATVRNPSGPRKIMSPPNS